MTLSELIIKYRTTHGLSQREFASRCSVSAGYISLIEKEINPQTGKHMVPTLVVLNKLANAMGMDIDELLSVCDDMPVDISSDSNEANPITLTEHEVELVKSYRAHPEMQSAVDTLLGVTQKASQKKQA